MKKSPWSSAKMIRAGFLAAVVLAFAPAVSWAKETRFWNLTTNTITALQLSPSGKNEWGHNQTDNDRDGTVDHDERLKITDAPTGIYDVKFADKGGRTCIARNIRIKEGAIFTIEEKELKSCSQ